MQTNNPIISQINCVAETYNLLRDKTTEQAFNEHSDDAERSYNKLVERDYKIMAPKTRMIVLLLILLLFLI
jgi:hypothetical protein